MNITLSPVNSYNNVKVTTQKVKDNQSLSLSQIKFDTISFSGKPKDLMTLSPGRIIKECRKALKDGIVIGEGQEAVVYKFEDYVAYCLRRDKIKAENPLDFKLSTELNKYDKVNHVVAKLDDGTVIMKYISGIPLKIFPGRDTPDGIQVKKAVQGLIANNFPESSFRRILRQVEDAKSKGIDFDRKGENLLVEVVNQEFNCIDFSPNFKDVEYNPISYLYYAIDVDKTEHAPKVFGKLCKAYAQNLVDMPEKKLNFDVLDTNFYHRGFMDDPFNDFPDRRILGETQARLEEIIELKKSGTATRAQLQALVNDFKDFIDDRVFEVKKQSFFFPFE